MKTQFLEADYEDNYYEVARLFGAVFEKIFRYKEKRRTKVNKRGLIQNVCDRAVYAYRQQKDRELQSSLFFLDNSPKMW